MLRRKAFERATDGLVPATLHRVQVSSNISASLFLLTTLKSPIGDAPCRHSIVFFAGLPLGQTYTSLQVIFMKSSLLKAIRNRHDEVSSAQYLRELEKLVVSHQPVYTFGDGQLKMWQR